MPTAHKIPSHWKLGVATAATHIEGGEQFNNWYRWSEQGKIKDGSHVKVACDHINRMEEDVKLIEDLHCDTYRMGLEWSRIEPEEGKFSKEGIEIYRKEIELLREKKIEPLITLWHFSNPIWFEDDGGWVSKKSVPRFLRYVRFVMEHLADVVDEWITINEPNVYLFFAYFEGIWPPGKKGNIRSFLNGAHHMIKAHQDAYVAIHHHYAEQGYKSPRVGVAHHLRIFDPADHRKLTQIAVKLINRVFQGMFLEGMTTGKSLFPLLLKRPRSMQVFADFMGVNYYSRDMVRGVINPLILFGERFVAKGSKTNDLGWEIYPEGLKKICKEVYQKYRLPIYITENGVCDQDDKYRQTFIYEHLQQLVEAETEGVDIRRYYHWSLLDNLEWAEGQSARFGLYYNDFESQQRMLRKSGEYFGQICETKTLI